MYNTFTEKRIPSPSTFAAWLRHVTNMHNSSTICPLLENGRTLLELLPSENTFLLHPAFLFLLLPDFVVELVRHQLLLDFGLKKVLRPIHADLVHVDLGEAGQLAQAGIGHELAGAGFPVNEQKLAERNLAVLILVHFRDHTLQAQVRLWGTELLHHELELGQIEKAIVADVVLGERGLVFLDLLPREFVKFGVNVHDPVRVLYLLAVLQGIVDGLTAVEDGEQLVGHFLYSFVGFSFSIGNQYKTLCLCLFLRTIHNAAYNYTQKKNKNTHNSNCLVLTYCADFSQLLH